MATTPSKRAAGDSPTGKLGICSPKRMQPNLPAHRARRAGGHQPVRRRSQASATSPWAAWKERRGGSPGGGRRNAPPRKKPPPGGERDGARGGGPRPRGGVARQQLLGKRATLEH